MAQLVNLYSDTQTKPTAGMRRAIAEADVGDEQRFEDPTVRALEERLAELLGHDAAVFLSSGTMCNGIGFRVHLRPGGDEALVDRTSHPINFEAGGPAAISGAMLQPLEVLSVPTAPASLSPRWRPPDERRGGNGAPRGAGGRARAAAAAHWSPISTSTVQA